MLDFIILFSKTMSELKRGLGLAMEIQGSLSQSLCLVTKEKDLEERPRNVEFGRIMYRVIDCNVRKIVHLDAKGSYALYLPALYSHLGLSIPSE